MLAAPLRPTPMPARHPHIAHFMPYLRGDSLNAIRLARRLGYRYVDMNLQCTSDGHAVIVHWADARKNGYEWRWTGRYDAKGREVRVRVPSGWKVTDHTLAQVLTLRSAEHGGRRPRLPREAMELARRLDIVICFEAKGSSGFRNRLPFDRLALDACRTRALVVVMTLQNLPGALVRLTHAAAAGFAVALLPRNPKPSNWETAWVPLGIKKWGHWRRR